MQMYYKFVKRFIFSENGLILKLADSVSFMETKIFKEWMSVLF